MPVSKQLDTLIGCSTSSLLGYPLIDPSCLEEDASTSKMTVALMAIGEIAQISLLGQCEVILMREVLNLATDGCAAIYEQIKPILQQ